MRKVRHERNLSQSNVAKIFGVATDSVTYWENNRHQPTVKQASRIIKFIGYFPFDFENADLYTRVKYARMIAGHSLKDMGKEIRVDASSMYMVFNGRSKPKIEYLDAINKYISRNLSLFQVL